MTALRTTGGVPPLGLAALALLVVAVPLLPFRYLPLSGLPALLAAAIGHMPSLLCGVVALLWLWQARGNLRRDLERLPLAWPVAALLLVGLLSSVGAAHPVASVARTLYYFATGVLLFLAVVGLVREPRHARPLLWCFLGAGYAVAFYGLLEFALGHNPLYAAGFDPQAEAYRRLVPDPWFERRIVSTIGHPVVLGSYLVLVLPVSLSVAFQARTGVGKGSLLLATATVAGALLLTFSRGAWLAAAAGLAVFLLLRGVRHLVLLPVALAAAAVPVLLFSRVSDTAAARLHDAYQSYVLNFASTTRGAAYGYTAVIADR
ncbi:MAG: hypothetical protein AB1505_36850, partial [Candidatus Latescibacterota bacterium]